MSDRLLTGFITLIVAIIVGTLVYRAYFPEEKKVQTVAPTEVPPPEEAVSTQIKARLTSCDRAEGGKTVAKGHVTNIGNVDLHFISVRVHWLNSADQTIEANDVFVLNDEILAPGDKKTFINATTKTSAVRCNVESIDWW
jgi:hypothetical protein